MLARRIDNVLPQIGGALSRNTKRHELWSAAHRERAALVADLSTLGDAQWSSPSLCDRWNIREVLAHLTAAASIGPARWFASVLGARFDFDLHNERRMAEHLGSSPADTLARFRHVVNNSTAPFGPVQAWLGEVIIHAQDIRRPLGIEHTVPMEAATSVAVFYAGRDFAVNSKSTAAGLRLVANDGPFASGNGPLVSGSTLALAMAMAGRGTYCDELNGPGAETLRMRCGPAEPGRNQKGPGE
ncbi:MAG: maleylpyruvate isomerase family mycothiol-dependent enzyme [Micrococcaceae bacterium]|nr:maleylpyruvate isomerase family mycothiol-dependent enzyme [Micrococcaceae bacterium]